MAVKKRKTPSQSKGRAAKASASQKSSAKKNVAKSKEVAAQAKGGSEYVPRSIRRHHLDNRLKSLYHRAMIIEQQLVQLEEDRFYRCCIFGSARIKPESKIYQDVYKLARILAWEGIDILTGGGPGLMEAANRGAKLGKNEKKTKSLSFGLSIQLDFEPEPNKHLDVKRHHQRFSSRLDDFMRLSHSIIVTPGGIGTLLELYFAWQLIQVKHMSLRPIVLLDRSFWSGIINWMREVPLERGLVSQSDFDRITIVDTPEEAAQIISAHKQEILKSRALDGGKISK